MTKTILITGINGFIGGEVAFQALDQGIRVFGLSRGGLNESLLAAGITDWRRTIVKPELDSLIHLAGNPVLGNSNSYSQSEVLTQEAADVFLEFSKKNGRFVFASSIAAMDYYWSNRYRVISIFDDPNPRSQYGKSKLVSENLIEELIPNRSSIARIGMVIGEMMRPESHVRYLAHVLRRWPGLRLLLRHSSGVLPMIHVRDCADILLHLASGELSQKKIFVFTEQLSVSSVVARLVGSRSDFRLFRFPAFLNTLLPPRIAGILGPVLQYDNSEIFSNGWAPKIRIDEYLSTWNSS